MKRTRISLPMLVAALAATFAALALGSSYETRSYPAPAATDRVAAVFVYDASGNVIWSDTHPGYFDDDYYRQAARVRLVDASGRTVFEAPVEWYSKDGSSPDAYVMTDGRAVKLEYLVREAAGYRSYDDDYRDGYRSYDDDHDDDDYDDDRYDDDHDDDHDD